MYFRGRFAIFYFDARVGAHPSDFCSGLYIPAKVTKTIRSAVHGCTNAAMPGWRGAVDAQPFGFPRALGFGFLHRSTACVHAGVDQTGKAVNPLHSNIRPLDTCFSRAVRLRKSQLAAFSLTAAGATVWAIGHRVG
jgi:hypothetical protein